MAVTAGIGWVGGVSWATGLGLLTLTLTLLALVTLLPPFVLALAARVIRLVPEGGYLWLVLGREGRLGLIQIDGCHLESCHADLPGGQVHLIRRLKYLLICVLVKFHVAYVSTNVYR